MTGRPIDHIQGAVANLASVAAGNDAATTALAAEIEALKVRVRNDDISPEDLALALDSLSASANSISSDSADIAGLASDVAGVESSTDPGS